VPSTPPSRASRPRGPSSSGRVFISSITKSDGKLLYVSDMDFAVYLYMHRAQEGLELLDAVRVGRFSHEFIFSMPERGDAMMEKARRLELSLANSPEALRFSNAQRDLKRFMRRKDRERVGQGGTEQHE